MKISSLAPAFVTIFAFSSCCLALAREATVVPQLALKQDFEPTDSVREWRLQTPPDAKAYSLTRDSAPGQAHSGQAALKYEVTSPGEKERYIFSGAKLPAAAENAARALQVRFWARTSSPVDDQVFTFRVLERDQTKPTGWVGGKTEAVKIENATEWKEYAFTANLAAKTQGLTLYVVARNPVTGQAVWIDDLSLEVVAAK